ncbi:MAG: molybdate ABC transporter permease subunit [Acidimicrobiaceae bacterium]|nr:molybdate ABC transporter permease subunit [Acidimicrobiaceae bacterium]
MRARLPVRIRAVALGALVFIATPLLSLLWRVPWSRLVDLLTRDVVTDALLLSLISSVAAALAALALGIPLALQLARMNGFVASVVRAVVVLPMILPPVVGGAALLFAFGRKGLVGSVVSDVTGFVVPYTLTGVIVANTFVALPFVVLTVEGALRALDPRFELAAATLGANETRVTFRVVLPMVRPALIAGGFLAWARALGEFGATITFAGNIQGKTQTLPLAVFVALETDREAALAMSVVLIAVSLLILVSLRDRWWPVR